MSIDSVLASIAARRQCRQTVYVVLLERRGFETMSLGAFASRASAQRTADKYAGGLAVCRILGVEVQP